MSNLVAAPGQSPDFDPRNVQTVRVREIDNRGRINLTLRGVPQSGDGSGDEPQPTPVAPLS